jgi:hypothetical protein
MIEFFLWCLAIAGGFAAFAVAFVIGLWARHEYFEHLDTLKEKKHNMLRKQWHEEQEVVAFYRRNRW